MDVDERLPRIGRLEERVAARRHLAEPAADREHEVGVAKPAGDAPRPSRRRARRRSSASGCRRSPGSGTRTRPGARSPRRTPARRGSSRPSSRPRRRRRAGAPQPRGAREAARDPRRCGADALRLDARAVRDVGLLGEHVLGQREHDRPGPPGERDRERLGHVLGDPLGAVDLPRRLRDAAEHLRVVELLPRLAAAKRARHLADEEEHRRRVLLRRVHADRRLRRSRPARDEADPGPPGQLPVRLGRVRRALLVAARDQPDRRVVERVEHRQVALPGRQNARSAPFSSSWSTRIRPPVLTAGTSRRTVARWSRGLSSSAGST